MSNILMIGLGILLVQMAINDQFKLVSDAVTGYQSKLGTSPFNYLLAGLAVSVPTILLESTATEENNNIRNAWYYVFLIMLSLLIFYRKEITDFANVTQKEFGK